MQKNLITYHTITFDVNGKLHIPTAYGVRFTEPVNGQPPLEDDIEIWDTWTGAEIIYRIVYDHDEYNTRLDRVYPFPQNDVGEVSLPFDFNNDGIIDESLCEFNDYGELVRFFIGSLPHYYWQNDHRKLANQLKMTAPNDGLMAMMWIDSYKAYVANTSDGSGWVDYLDTSELFIILSENNGETWSAPLQLNSVNTPELYNMKPSFIYPADIPLRQGSASASLYFMFTDDLEYGLIDYDGIGNYGAYVRLAAIDVSWGVSIQEPDFPLIKPNILSQNYPNPFNPSTNINFNIPNSGKVNLSVYNVRGQLVKTIIDDIYIAGSHSVSWHGDDNNSKSVASGVYFYKIDFEGKEEIKKMILMK